MSRKRKWLVLSSILIVMALATTGILIGQQALASPESQPDAPGVVVPPGWYWSYAVKFVCGQQGPLDPNQPGEPTVKPGNYATDINIHNPFYDTVQVPVFKKLVILVDFANAAAPLVIR